MKVTIDCVKKIWNKPKLEKISVSLTLNGGIRTKDGIGVYSGS